jgi:glutamate racemase
MLEGAEHEGRMLRDQGVLVFDSGLGGLTVLREIARLRPDFRPIYAADDAAFPYGRWGDAALAARVVEVVGGLIERFNPALVVIACNTASTLALPLLRARFSIPFVGTVPAIKPACERSLSKRVSVLATPGTVKRDYTQALIREFAAGCEVALVGSDRLASLAEAALHGEEVDDAAIATEVASCFVDDGARTDTVVLACTHYPLILERLVKAAPWPVQWIDPAPAIARRASSLFVEKGEPSARPIEAFFTSGRPPSPALVRSLRAFNVVAAAPEAARLPV